MDARGYCEWERMGRRYRTKKKQHPGRYKMASDIELKFLKIVGKKSE